MYIIVNNNINEEGEEIEGYAYDDPDDPPLTYPRKNKIPVLAIHKLIRWMDKKGISSEDIRDCLEYIKWNR